MRKRAELRKAEIVQTVLDLADQIGPDRVTTNAVAGEIDVTQVALFRHFPSKAALWQSVAEQLAETMATAWEAALQGADGPEARILALIGAQLSQIEATPALPMLLFSRELNVENDALRGVFRTQLARFHALLLAEVDQAQKQALFRPDIPADDVVVLLTSLVQGVAIRWVLGKRDFSLLDTGLRLLNAQLRLLSTDERT